MEDGHTPECHRRAVAAAASVTQSLDDMVVRRSTQAQIMPTSTSPGRTPADAIRYLQQTESERGTVLYLAYGSNLSKQTFRGSRGIQPLSQINVQVPSLRLTFDLPGIAYTEPCFANTARRDPDNDPPPSIELHEEDGEKSTPLLSYDQRDRYRKDRWHKGLIGVVYEVTPEDYAHIIRTEGGGSSYQDILVDCHPFASRDPTLPVPQKPTLPPFKAHTLFAPVLAPDDDVPEGGGRLQRPDTSYAQASARYLKLITDGAAELGLPYEYQDYLQSLGPYTITTYKQRAGQVAFIAMWLPFILMVFGLGKVAADKNGRLPKWLRDFTTAVFKAAWKSYDKMFRPVFGDGERTVGDDGEDDEDSPAARRRRRAEGSSDTDTDAELVAEKASGSV